MQQRWQIATNDHYITSSCNDARPQFQIINVGDFSLLSDYILVNCDYK